MFICNPIPPTLPDDGDLDNGYWDEVDRYIDEVIVVQILEERENNGECCNKLQYQR